MSYMAKKWLFGCKLKIFINLGLWIFIKFNGTPFIMYFIENNNKKNFANFAIIMKLGYSSMVKNVIITVFIEIPDIFWCFHIFSWNCNLVIITQSKWVPEKMGLKHFWS